MAISSLVLTALSYLAGSIKESDGVKNAKNELSQSLWEWVRPIFLVDEEPLNELKANPEDDIIQTEIASKMERYIRKHPNKESELKKLIESFKHSESKTNPIQVSQVHSGSGDNVAGNKIVKG